MIRLLFDENFNGRIIRGLRRLSPELDAVRVQEAGLLRWEDPQLLEWAAEQGRVMVSHDVTTMSAFARDRTAAGFPMTGLILVSSVLGIGQVITDLQVVAECSEPEDFKGVVLHLPL